MKKIIRLSLVFAFFLIGRAFAQKIDIQGHRGCRGLMPENSIPGFLKAIDLGVTTLELDVVVSADGKVVVSHEPYMSSKFCINELGRPIKKKDETDINLFQLYYDDIKLFDCGVIGNSDFPDQEQISVYKPLLSEVIEKCEEHTIAHQQSSVQYNIELKSRPSWDGIYHPEPYLFTELVYNVIKNRIPVDRVIIQSFDQRILQLWKIKYGDYKISLLISNSKSAIKNIDDLGFTPDIYSPNYKQVNSKDMTYLKSKNILVVPWTINETKDMKRLIGMGVDGFITDYPNRYLEHISSFH